MFTCQVVTAAANFSPNQGHECIRIVARYDLIGDLFKDLGGFIPLPKLGQNATTTGTIKRPKCFLISAKCIIDFLVAWLQYFKCFRKQQPGGKNIGEDVWRVALGFHPLDAQQWHIVHHHG